jgi:hypothetical protein
MMPAAAAAPAAHPVHGTNLATLESTLKQQPATNGTPLKQEPTTPVSAPQKQEHTPGSAPGDALDMGMFLDEEVGAGEWKGRGEGGWAAAALKAAPTYRSGWYKHEVSTGTCHMPGCTEFMGSA